MQFRIELRQHIGQCANRFGSHSVRHPQDIVMLISEELRESWGTGEIEIGMAGHNTGTIEFLPYAHQLEPADVQRICDEVGRLTGRPRRANLPAIAQDVTRTESGYVPDLDEPQGNPVAIPDLDAPLVAG